MLGQIPLSQLEQQVTLPAEQNATFLAYKAIVIAFKARATQLPNVKLQLFWQASGLLEQAVMSEPKNIEVRFLRWCIEKEVPSFMNRWLHLSEDVCTIIQEMPESTLPPSFLIAMVDYLLVAASLSQSQVSLLRSWQPFLSAAAHTE